MNLFFIFKDCSQSLFFIFIEFDLTSIEFIIKSILIYSKGMIFDSCKNPVFV